MINPFKEGDKVRPYGYVEYYDAYIKHLERESDQVFWFIEDYEKIFGIVEKVMGERLLLKINSFDMCMGWIPVLIHYKQCERFEG